MLALALLACSQEPEPADAVPAPVPTTPEEVQEARVAAGMSKVAGHYGVSVEQIEAWNDPKNGDFLDVSGWIAEMSEKAALPPKVTGTRAASSGPKCKEFVPDPEADYDMPEGLDYEQLKPVLDRTIQKALACPRPDGLSSVDLTFELLIGCDGKVKKVEASDDGGAPSDYVACVAGVLKKGRFPAHELLDGQEVTYPVQASWE